MNQPKILRRYRVGVDLDRYARIFILGCVVSAFIAIIVTLAIASAAFYGIYTNTVNRYEAEVANLTERLEGIEQKHQEEIDKLNEEHANALQQLNDVITSLNSRVEQLIQTSMTDFEVLRRYWYVFKDAPDNSGLSVDLITYTDDLCKEWDVNPHWMWHIWQRETGWTVNLDNKEGSGARGLGQLMPSTGKKLYENVLQKGTYTHDMAYDPFINAELSICHIGRNIAIGSMTNAMDLYSGGGGSRYYNSVVSKGRNHGIALSDSNAHYPY